MDRLDEKWPLGDFSKMTGSPAHQERWCGLIETVSGGDSLINRGVQSLLKLSEKIDKEKMREPAFLMVLCAAARLPLS